MTSDWTRSSSDLPSPQVDFAEILDTIPLGLVVLDRHLRVVFWNHWMEVHSRLPREEVLGKDLLSLYPDLEKKGFPWKAETVFQVGNFAFFSQRLHHYVFPFASASHLQSDYRIMQQNAVLAPLRGSDDEVAAVCLSVFDITDTVIYQERLIDSAQQLRLMSQTDALTRLSNRRHILQRLEEELARHARIEACLSLAIMDIDFFKRINDTYGHLVGDDVLVGLAAFLREAVRTYDMVGRYGGEEILVILPHTGKENAYLVMERLRQQLSERTFACNGDDVTITVSIGVSTTMAGRTTARDLLKAADDALYRAKGEGRNCTLMAS